MKKVITASLIGIEARTIMVETDIQPGLPYVHLVGLADATIREARERVRAAIVNSGFEFPKQRLTVNLSPAGVPKEGSHFDLPIAVGILAAGGSRLNTGGFGFMGELSLNGELKGVRGALPLAMRLREEGIRRIIVPEANAQEVSLLKDISVYPAASLKDCIGILNGDTRNRMYKSEEPAVTLPGENPDFADVKGNENVKRALVIAAAGNHGILMIGSPGCGKTMMARRIPFILPDMTYEEQLEAAKIHSAAGSFGSDYILSGRRPFRAPHHTITKAALIGGGTIPRPGEISLAHNGVLFLDEFGEFNPSVLELLRQPLEDGIIPVHRLKTSVEFPCRIMLVAAANPCRCGYYGEEEHICTCSQNQLESYYSRFSGPMLDRIDMQVAVRPVGEEGLKENTSGMNTDVMKEMVVRAVEVQRKRYAEKGDAFNGRLQEAEIKRFCRMDEEGEMFMREAFRNMKFSMRVCSKLLRIARTIADLDGSRLIQKKHIAEAIQFRSLDIFDRR